MGIRLGHKAAPNSRLYGQAQERVTRIFWWPGLLAGVGDRARHHVTAALSGVHRITEKRGRSRYLRAARRGGCRPPFFPGNGHTPYAWGWRETGGRGPCNTLSRLSKRCARLPWVIRFALEDRACIQTPPGSARFPMSRNGGGFLCKLIERALRLTRGPFKKGAIGRDRRGGCRWPMPRRFGGRG